jgi:hypothetical protein
MEMIKLSKNKWWEELSEIIDFPIEVIMLLRSLIGSYGKKVIPPNASDPYLKKLAIEYLSEGFKWGDEYFDVLVYEPDNLEDYHPVFHMIRKWGKDGKFKRLSELETKSERSDAIKRLRFRIKNEEMTNTEIAEKLGVMNDLEGKIADSCRFYIIENFGVRVIGHRESDWMLVIFSEESNLEIIENARTHFCETKSKNSN